jgi:hypothetical protein
LTFLPCWKPESFQVTLLFYPGDHCLILTGTKGREEGKGREGKGREGKGREGKRREEKGREGKRRERKEEKEAVKRRPAPLNMSQREGQEQDSGERRSISSWPWAVMATAAARLVNKSLASPGL